MCQNDFYKWLVKNNVSMPKLSDLMNLIDAMIVCGADMEESRKAATEFWESTH